MSKQLTVSPDLSLPLETITMTAAVLGNRGSGKTNTGVVVVEELLRQGQQVVVIDPLDGWFGLKSSADGKSAGFPIIVLGGYHGDLPLESTSGAAVADFVADNPAAAVVLSLRHFESQADQRRFVTDFARRLFHRKGEPGRNTPLLLTIDEAALFIPQRVMGESAQMVGAIQKLVRQGRTSGIGVMLIDQRAASVNKDVLTQLELLIAHRTTSPQDRGAMDEWVKAHDTGDHRDEFLSSLASLPVGTAWFWSPGWLDVFLRVKVRHRQTFDSSATPKVGQKVAGPQKLADVDLSALRQRFAASIEKAKADDPRELRRRIADLEKKLAARPAETVEKIVENRVEVPVLKNGQLNRTEKALARMEAFVETSRAKLAEVLAPVVSEAAELRRMIAPATAPRPAAPARAQTPVRQTAVQTRPVAPCRPVPPADAVGRDALTGPERKILDALAWLESIGVDVPEQPAAAFLAGYTVGGGAWNNPRGALRTKGLIEYLPGDRMRLTDAGRVVAEAPAGVLTADELHRKVLDVLPGPERKLLAPLLASYPNVLSNEDLAAAAGYSTGGGAYNNPRGRLRTLGLVEYREGGVVARSILFPNGN